MSQARRRQLRASSGGSSDATSKASFPLHNTEVRQQQGNLDVLSAVVLSCCCCPSAGAELCICNRYKWNVPIPLGCGVYPIRRGLGFTPRSFGQPPWCHHHGGKACSLRSALCQTKTNDVQSWTWRNLNQPVKRKPPNSVLHGRDYISPKIIPSN